MKKDINDYLHFYIGCEMILEKSGRIAKLLGVQYCEDGIVVYDGKTWASIKYFPFKLLLRKVSSMTKQELKESAEIFTPGKVFSDKETDDAINFIRKQGINSISFEQTDDPTKPFNFFRWLLSKHFDVFGLIEAGVANEKADEAGCESQGVQNNNAEQDALYQQLRQSEIS